jgi:hypothetical protein
MGAGERLHDELTRQAIPIVGVSEVPRRIDYADAATVAQRVQGNTLLGTWDWSPRRPRKLADLITAINALAAADRQKLLTAAAAELLQRYPRLAIGLGITLDGDELDPLTG